MSRLLDLGVREQADLVRGGAITGDAVARESLARIVELEQPANGERLNAALAVVKIEGAAAIREGPLAGTPIAVKDNIVTRDLPTTCGSRMLEGFRSHWDATVVHKLREAGAVIVAKTNMDEFGMGSTTEQSAFGPTRNPRDLARVPGGSSGGSAALVAAGAVRVALGSDTGGSVRQPAAWCGVVGLKPTWGRVSRFGLVAFASSLDQPGVIAATVADAEAVFNVIAGHDPNDMTSSTEPLRGTPSGERLDGLVVGCPKEYFEGAIDRDVADVCRVAIDALRERGATVRDVSLPGTELAIPAYYIIAPAEASANLARFDGVRYGARAEAGDLAALYERTRSRGFGAEVKRRILLGTYALSAGYYDAFYTRAVAVRSTIASEFASLFASGVDVLLTPTTPTPAFRLGEVSDPYQMYLSDVFTVPASLAGIPAISIPAGFARGLPVGVQLMGGHFREDTLLRTGRALEEALSS
ncbi:MAG: Asp-tRNA(Asn)/Glu-tRNA(Gln) amidotransferase subunit GatA [Gemmatimonadota bacterium]